MVSIHTRLNDDLPDPESLSDSWDNLPELAPELIKGVLRQGHKMLIAGPSKAGKSFALIEMSIAIAEGKKMARLGLYSGACIIRQSGARPSVCLTSLSRCLSSDGIATTEHQ